MEIHHVYSVSSTEDDCLMIDMDFTGVEGRGRTVFAYRATDPYSPLTPIITQWLADNDPEILPYTPPPPPTPEELRAAMPSLSKAQLRLGLLLNGITADDVEAVIDTIEDPIEKSIALINWHDRSWFERIHPLIAQVGGALGLSPEQIDSMWTAALDT